MGLRRKKSTEPKKPRERGSRRVRGAIAAVLLAALGATGLVAFVKGAEQRALAGERLVDVLVVKSQIDAGTPTEEMQGSIRKERVPAKTRADRAIDDLGDVQGHVAGIELVPGEQITTHRLVAAHEYGRIRGQVAPPDDLLEVTISLEPQRAVGGVVKPGSTVAVLASFEPFDSVPQGGGDGIVPEGGKTPDSTHMILHKVLITNVQTARSFSPGVGGGGEDDEESATAQAPTENLLVTLALDAASVEEVVFAAEHGTIWLAFEPDGASEDGTRVVTRGSIYQ